MVKYHLDTELYPIGRGIYECIANHCPFDDEADPCDRHYDTVDEAKATAVDLVNSLIEQLQQTRSELLQLRDRSSLIEHRLFRRPWLKLRVSEFGSRQDFIELQEWLFGQKIRHKILFVSYSPPYNTKFEGGMTVFFRTIGSTGPMDVDVFVFFYDPTEAVHFKLTFVDKVQPR